MAGFMNMLSYWLFFLSSLIMISSLFAESGPEFRVDNLPSFKCFTTSNWWFWFRYDIMVGFDGYFHCILNGIFKLYSYRNQFEDRGNVHD
jgi:hypothetical protein